MQTKQAPIMRVLVGAKSYRNVAKKLRYAIFQKLGIVFI